MSVKLNQQFCDLESGWMLCRWKVATLGHFAYLQFSYLKDILIKENGLNMLNSQCHGTFYTLYTSVQNDVAPGCPTAAALIAPLSTSSVIQFGIIHLVQWL